MKLVVPLVFFAAPAFAVCPTAADMERGVRLLLDDGEELVVRATDDPAIRNIERTWPDGQFVADDVAWGLFFVETTELNTGEEGGWALYSVLPSFLPRPSPETRVTLPLVRTGNHYPQDYRDEYRMGELGSLTLAGCHLRAFEVERFRTRLMIPEGEPPAVPEQAGEWVYFEDLGFALERWGYSIDGLREVEVISFEPAG